MLVVFLVLPLLSQGSPVRDPYNRWELEEHPLEDGVGREQREGLMIKEPLDTRASVIGEGRVEDREGLVGESTGGGGISRVEIEEDEQNVYVFLPKLRAEGVRLKEREEEEEQPAENSQADLDDEESVDQNTIRYLGLLDRQGLLLTEGGEPPTDAIWRIGDSPGTPVPTPVDEEAEHVEIGEEEGKIYILLPKLRTDEEVLEELDELDGPLFGEGVGEQDPDDMNTIRLLQEVLASIASRIEAEEFRERREDQREMEEDAREELGKRSNDIEIDEGVDSYRILMPKEEKLGRIKLGNWVARKAGGKGVRIKGQGDGRGGHTIYRNGHGDFDEVNMF